MDVPSRCQSFAIVTAHWPALEAEYNWDRVAAQHREVYENVLSGAG